MNVGGVFPKDSRKLTQLRDFEQMCVLPAPTGLTEAKARLGSGYPNIWYEYVPKNYRGVLISGLFFVPIEEIAADLHGKHCSIAADVMYIADHHSELGRYTARILRQILGGEQVSF